MPAEGERTAEPPGGCGSHLTLAMDVACTPVRRSCHVSADQSTCVSFHIYQHHTVSHLPTSLVVVGRWSILTPPPHSSGKRSRSRSPSNLDIFPDLSTGWLRRILETCVDWSFRLPPTNGKLATLHRDLDPKNSMQRRRSRCETEKVSIDWDRGHTRSACGTRAG